MFMKVSVRDKDQALHGGKTHTLDISQARHVSIVENRELL
jgi:hypothetical protein